MAVEAENTEQKRKKLLVWLRKAAFPWDTFFRWMIFALGLTGLVFLFPHGTTPQFSDLKLNYISHREIIAPFDFEILKTEGELARERKAAQESVMPFFKRNDEVTERNLACLDSLLDDLQFLQTMKMNKETRDSVIKAELERVNQYYKLTLSQDIFQTGKQAEVSVWWAEFTEKTIDHLTESYRRGIFNLEPDEITTTSNAAVVLFKGIEQRVSLYSIYGTNLTKGFILDKLKESFPPGDSRVKFGYEIVLGFLEPNIIYQEQITENRRIDARNKVALAKGIVLKNERIIDSNERVAQEHLDKLRSLSLKKAELSMEVGGIRVIFPFAGKFLFSGGILLVLGFMVFNYRSEITPNKNLLLIVLILLAQLAFLRLVMESANLPAMLFPSALGIMLITIFYGYGVGFWYMITLALLAGVMQGNDFQLTLITLVVGTIAIVSIKKLRSRTQLMTSALYLGVAYVVFLTGFHFMQFSFSTDLLQEIGLGMVNSALTPILVLGFAIILGNIFDITTDLTLLELSDLNRPLLRKLAEIAPGTYHHSLMVGTLAEAAAEAVGANPLMARTAAYYHDIGKIERWQFFVENQGVLNPHDTITPEESAEVLNSHVDSGMELAEKHRLPQAIKDVIVQHHGSMLMQYFYHKAAKQSGEEIDDSKYRYKGPLPASRESGIIMLADGVEAAVRSMGLTSNEQIREKVKEIIEGKFDEGQLDQCELSLKDLQIVEDTFVHTLTAQRHRRIEYPDRKDIAKEVEE